MSLQHRLALLTGVALTATVGVLLWAGLSAVDQTEDEAQRVQLAATAQVVAGHVDDVLTRTVGREEHLARMVANAWSQGEAELNNLLDAYPRFLFESDLFLVRPQGDLVWSMRPGAVVPGGMMGEPLVEESADSGRSAVGSCAASAAPDASRACFVSPVVLREDEIAAVILAQIDLARPDLNLFSLEHLNERFRIELTDAEGTILAANDGGAGASGARTESVASGNGAGDSVRDESVGGGNGHPIGYARVSLVPGWGVVVEPREAGALAFGGGAEQRLLAWGLLALAVSLALGWLAVRLVTKSLSTVATEAGRVAAGDLNTPVTVARGDDLGMLARAIESLRINLRDAVTAAEEARRTETARGYLLDGLLARQEEERQRIAHELHEETLQSLAALAMRLDSVQSELPAGGRGAGDRLARVHSLASALIEDLRRLAVQLRPPMLDDLGLASAIQSYASSRLSSQGMRVNLEMSGLEERPPSHVEASLYRVAEEAINNIAVHAEAKTVTLVLRRVDKLLTLSVEDDGRGFDAAEVLADPNAARGLGILSMRERVALLDGTFTIESRLGQGTRVLAEIPLQSGGSAPS